MIRDVIVCTAVLIRWVQLLAYVGLPIIAAAKGVLGY